MVRDAYCPEEGIYSQVYISLPTFKEINVQGMDQGRKLCGLCELPGHLT